MKFLYLLFLVIVISATHPDDYDVTWMLKKRKYQKILRMEQVANKNCDKKWNLQASNTSYIRVLNKFFQSYYNACIASCPQKTYFEFAKIDTKYGINREKVEQEAIEKFELIRKKFEFAKYDFTNNTNTLETSQNNNSERIRAAIQQYCNEVRNNNDIEESYKKLPVLMEGYLIYQIYWVDLQLTINAQHEFLKDCYGSPQTNLGKRSSSALQRREMKRENKKLKN